MGGGAVPFEVYKKVICQNCFQEQTIPFDAKEFTCPVCGYVNKLL